MLQTKHSGLTQSQAKKLLQEHGPNTLTKAKKRNYLKELWKEVKNPMTLILIFASGVSFALGETIDSSIILGIIVLNITLGFFQKFKADKAVEKLQSLVNPQTKVFRDNKLISIDSKLLVPGDIIKLSEGDLIPADAEILESKQFYVQESTLTGESVPLNKKSEDKLFMGTESVQGTAIAKVTETGQDTEFGQIADLTAKTKKDLSPLQKEIVHLSHNIAKAMLLIAAIFFAVSLYKNGTDKLLETIIFTASVAVAAVPEGLPTTITLSLSLGIQRLAKKGSIIKNLSSVETLGSTDILVTDKTGTLTKNEMTVTKILTQDHNIQVSGSGYEPKGTLDFPSKNIQINHKTNKALLSKSPKIDQLLRDQSLVSLYCNDSLIEEKNGTYQLIGDPTEGALITLANKTPYNQKHLSNHEILDSIPFNSQDKFMATLVQNTETKKKYILVKGAPEMVLDMTNLNSKAKKELNQKTDQLAEEALRTLALAIKETRAQKLSPKVIQDLEFVSITGIIDPPRLETKGALQEATQLGLQTIMATGDHPLTAKAIGSQLGFSSKHVYKGDQVEEMTDKQLTKIIQTGANIIFARVKPAHKLRIVNICKELGKIVGVTGDGVNDAPALKRADIGIAMGIAGTEVSKEAADMILTEDNFNDIISAIKEGRVIYQNIRKFLFYIFATNLGEIACIFVAFIVGLPLPLTAILLLVINLGTDVFPAISLSFEKEEDVTKEDSASRHLLNKPTILRILIQGTTLGLISVGLFAYTLSQTGNQILATSVCFVTLVAGQLMDALNAKHTTQTIFQLNTFQNWHLYVSIAGSFALALAIVYIPSLHPIFKTTQVPTHILGLILATSLIMIFTDETRKAILRRTS
jgi:Ca2+-transporting ATPase